MGIETRERVIGDCTYKVTTIGGEAAALVQLRLARALAASVSSGRGIPLAEGGAIKFDPHEALVALGDDDFRLIVRTFAPSTRFVVAGTSREHVLGPVFDDHFAGKRNVAMWQWLAFAIEVNFADVFFIGFDRIKAVLLGLGESLSSSRTTSTGSSGDSSSPTA